MTAKRFSVPMLAVAGVLICVGVPALAARPNAGKWTVETPAYKWYFDYNADGFFTIRTKNDLRRVQGFRLPRYRLSRCTPSAAGPFVSRGFKTHVKPKVRKGKFKFSEKHGSTAKKHGSTARYKTLKVRGHFTSKTQAKGTFTATIVRPSGKCTSGSKVRWTAKLG